MESYFRFWRPLPPPLHKISNNIVIYLTSYRILAPPPLSVIKIVKYCGVWGRGGGCHNPTKDNGAPLSVINLVKYCCVVGGGGGGAKILQRVMPAPLFVSKIVVSGGGGKIL